MKTRTLAGSGANLDRAVELLDVGLDHIHADPAPGDVGNLVLVEKAGQEDQVQALPLVQRVGILFGNQALSMALARIRFSAFMPCRRRR